MAGVLDGGGPPPAPRPDAQNSAPSNGVLSAPGASSPSIVPGQAAGQVPQTPAPTHGQTVAALRHFDAIRAELEALLKDPALGKSSLKSKIIDGMAKLVGSRIVTPGAAVAQLAEVPEKPFDQKKWLQQQLVQAMTAKITVLQHHGNAYGGTPEHLIDKRSSPDDHLADMQALHGHYGGARG